MLKILIRKEFRECFRSYFVNPKTNKARSKGKTALLIASFVFLMILLAFIFLIMAYQLKDLLYSEEGAWIYYAVMGTVSIAMGVFGSAFNTYSALYLAKDNDLLLSMPVPASVILSSRLSLVFGLSFIYCGIVWIPTILLGWSAGEPAAAAIIFSIILLVMIPVFVTAVSTALGWVIAAVSTKIKNKSFITVAISLIFISVYYYASARTTELIGAMVANSALVGMKIRKWGNLIYQLGKASCGNAVSLIIFSLISAALFAACFVILSKTFFQIVTKTPTASPVKIKKKTPEGKMHGIRSALFHKELRRFTSSPVYMLNCGLGIVIVLLLAGAGFAKRNELSAIIWGIAGDWPDIMQYLPLAVVFAVCLAVSINDISTPSVSLEGKNLWILQSLPVSAAQILKEKEKLHIVLNSVPAVFACFVLECCVQTNLLTALLCSAMTAAFIHLTAAFGLIAGLKKANLIWTNENKPIKQNLTVLLSMLFGMIAAVISCGAYLFVRKLMDVSNYVTMMFVVLELISNRLDKWLANEGKALFEEL